MIKPLFKAIFFLIQFLKNNVGLGGGIPHFESKFILLTLFPNQILMPPLRTLYLKYQE